MYRFRQFTLIVGDLICLYAGFILGILLRYLAWSPRDYSNLFSPIIQLNIVALLLLFIVGLYDVGRSRNTWLFFQKIIMAAIAWMIAGIIFFYINPQTGGVTPKTILLTTAITSFGLLALWRYCYNRFISTTLWQASLIFAGTQAEVFELAHLLQAEPERGYRVLGIVDPNAPAATRAALPQTASVAELLNQADVRYPDFIIISPDLSSNHELLNELYALLFHQTSVLDLATFYEQIMHKVPEFTFSESWFLGNLREQGKKVYDRLRILIDYSAAALMAGFFFVTFPFVALAIKVSSRGPLFFSQTRVGRNGKLFRIYKYRTMRALTKEGSAEVAGPQYASANDTRITAVGKILRRIRIDEIPQFVNILRGDMSIIGPRPERPEFVAELTTAMPYYGLRHLIKPGLTGWAQLQQGYYGDLKENLLKLQYDLYYVKNRNPLLDLTILLKTINVILRMSGR